MDERAFEDLVRTHMPAIWRHASALLGDDRWAEEAAQDTFFKAHRRIEQFRGEASIRTWLLAICHRVCIDRLRLRRLEAVPLTGAVETPSSDPELMVALRDAVNRLPAPERQAFVLISVLGYSSDEAAQITGEPSPTLRSRLGKARKRLIAALTDEEIVR